MSARGQRGSILDRILLCGCSQATDACAFVEQVADGKLNRSDFGPELGYLLAFLTPSLGLRVAAAGHTTHDGLVSAHR